MREHEAVTRQVRVWDLPLRLFHWLLAILVIVSFVTIKLGGNAIDWHIRSGYAILALLLFRVIWGFIGGENARFTRFVRGPGAIIRYLGEQFGAQPSSLHAGHNPLGALSVIALLALLLFQAISGLFSNDDIFVEGPLAKLISKETSDYITGLHKGNEWIILGLVVLHLLAIAYYRFVKKERLVKSMITGYKALPATGQVQDARGGNMFVGLVVFGAAAAVVWYVVTKV